MLNSLTDFQAISNSWTFLEVNVAIICACLPDIRSLVTKLIPCLGYKQSRSVSQYAAEGDFSRDNYTSKNITSVQSSPPITKEDASDEEFVSPDVKGVKKTAVASVAYNV